MQHLPAARVQAGQERFHPGEVVDLVPDVRPGAGQLIQQGAIERNGAAEVPVSPQQAPLLQGHAQLAEDRRLAFGLGSRFPSPLLLQTGQAGSLLALASRQAHRGRQITQVVQNRTANVGAGIGGKGGLLVGAIELRGSDQPQQAHLDQILAGLLTPTSVVARQGGHQMAVGFHQSVAALQS